MKTLASLFLCAALAASPVVQAAPILPPQAAEQNIRLDLRQATVSEVIRLLAEISHANIVATEAAAKIKVTVFLRGVSVRGALDAIAKSAGLWYRYDEDDRVFRVMTAEEYQKDIVVFAHEETRIVTLRNANVVAAANAVAALFGARVEISAPVADKPVFSVSGLAVTQSGAASGGTGGATNAVQSASAQGQNAGSANAQSSGGLSPGQISELLKKLADGDDPTLANLVVAPPPIRLTYNLQHNMLIVRSADAQALDEVQRLVMEMDRPLKQVLLEMKVLEVTLGDGMRSAFDFSITSGTTAVTDSNGDTTLVPKISLGTGNFPTEGGTLVFSYLDQRISARLQALASENRVRTLSTPILLTSNLQPAELFIGEERVLVTNVTSDTVTNNNQAVTTFTSVTEKRNIGNTLAILPRINADRTVSLSIVQDASRLLPKSATIPVGSAGAIQEFPIDTVNTSNLKVDIVAKDRLTVAVGGMIQEEVSNAESKVPLLGDLPGVGFFFKRSEKAHTKKQLVLVITPYIIDSPEEGEQRSRERVQAHAHSDGPGIDRYLDAGPAPGSPACADRVDAPCPPGPASMINTAPPAVVIRAGVTPPAPGDVKIAASRPAPASKPQPAPANAEDPLAALARAAAVRLKQRGAPGNDGLTPVKLATAPSFYLDAGQTLAAEPLASWRAGAHWVTALKLSNRSAAAIPLDTQSFPGRWLAAAIERTQLGGQGQPASQSMAYLISDRPFEAALAHLPEARP